MISLGKQTIKQVVVTLVTDDTEDYPEIQVSYNGKPTKGFRLSPYGLVSNPVTGSLAIAYSSQGQEAVKYIMPTSTIDRLKGLKEGDVGLYNEVTKDFAILTKEKGFEIFSSVGLVANIEGPVELTAESLTADITGATVLNAGTLAATVTGACAVTAPTINLNGAVIVAGLLTAGAGLAITGNANSTGDFSTTGELEAADFAVSGQSGISGSFTTVDLKTVTVTKGIITSIV